MTNFNPESKASFIESLQYGAGTNIIDVSAPVLSIASETLSNTGRSRCICPAFPGVTPPTILVPYSID